MRYEGYWGLRESPFRDVRNPAFFFASPTHDEALARLHFLADAHRNVGILSGCDGSGKTLLLAVFGRQLREQGRTVCTTSLLGQDLRGFLWTVAAGLGTNPRKADDSFGLWRQTHDRLRALHYVGDAPTLLLDDADLAAPEVLAHVLRLLKSDDLPHLTMILAAESAHVQRVGSDLLQLCELHIRLELWQPDDIRDYLHTSLRRAGRRASGELFEAAAVNRLYALSAGVPRYVRQLAELALVAGAGRRLDQIDAETIDAVFHELSLGTGVPVDNLVAV
jgi:type II secretory pathway predicted ATPase ExeA